MAVELTLPEPFSLHGESFVPAIFGADDLEEILAVEQVSHLHPWSLNNFRSSLSSHFCVGLRCRNRWVAHAILSFVVGEAELLLFVIAREWQGRGVGSQFLQLISTAAGQKAQTLFLEVRASNERAIALYENAGFNQVGVRPGYYPADKNLAGKTPAGNSHREDALLYALDLTFFPS